MILDASEDAYAASIGRNMWRVAKRRALLDATSGGEIMRAAFSGAPENKAMSPAQSLSEGAAAPHPAPKTLREFLQRLAAELASGGQDRSGS